MQQWIIGIDEAGRGPLAGPVSVGVCALGADFDLTLLEGIRDSKKLTEKKRNEWYQTITNAEQVKWSVVLMSAAYIDRAGIVLAIRAALERALTRLALDPRSCRILLDGGLHAPDIYTDQQTIVRGDATEPTISAAAILAKVTRDRYMIEQATAYPHYGFERHKGYGTKAHQEAIKLHGLCPLHRQTFCHIR